MKRAFAALALIFSFAAPACAQPQAQSRDVAGKFDYYLLALSWSPTYCTTPSGARDTRQCGVDRRFAFVLHGLWPQHERGYPRACASTQPRDVPAALVAKQLDIMPSPKLVEHEWDTHGVCTGLTQTSYFTTARTLRSKVVIPPAYVAPDKALSVSAAEVRSAFLKANAWMKPDGMIVDCADGRLREVRVCFTKTGTPRSCSASVRDRCTGKVVMPPIRPGAR